MSKHIKSAAQGIAALGRGPDTMLVHMTPNEVSGLHKLALTTMGTGLTVNPKTGLPEAGILSSILPMLVGGIATVASGGTLAPLWAAALGAGSGALGAKIEGEDPMTGALGGAMGGFGGGSLGSLVTNAGKMGAQGAVNQGLQQASTAAAQGMAQNTGQAAGQALVDGAINPVAANIAQQGMANGVQPLAQQAATQAASNVPAALVAPGQLSGKEAFMQGIKGLANKTGRDAMVQSWNALPSSQKLGVAGVGMTAASTASDAMGGSGGGKKAKNPYYYITQAEYDPNGFVSFTPGEWTKQYPYNSNTSYKAAAGGEVPDNKSAPQDLREQYMSMMRPAAPSPGVTVDPAAHNAYMARLNDLIHAPPPAPAKPFQQTLDTAPATSAVPPAADPKLNSRSLVAQLMRGGKNPTYDPADFQYSFDPNSGTFIKKASGGIAALAGGGSPPLPSRHVKGPGDGTSDSIPAVIHGPEGPQQRAALANDEFVIDARTVAEIGNGSSEAGARALYAMVDRIQKGRGKVGQKINPSKRLLA